VEGPKTNVRVKVKVQCSAKGKMGTKYHAPQTEDGSAYISQLSNSFSALQYARFGLGLQ
jgi:hypothetical protein